ncbi:hypothetical protein KIPB_008442 [Kipferlia bialata]|uniref:RING-type domain-containing protein n=1 Tax=Kipferlia bialata TaxID=797122 RepID=A0A9K3GLG6_9EUKA|nr:hypothetical protein KIPB_008442 [Kipferlia bialata]|eukprot:g8442.t1
MTEPTPHQPDKPNQASPGHHVTEAQLSLSSPTDSDSPLCAICQSGMGGTDTATLALACGHVFHAGCLHQWCHYAKDVCPLCRQSIDLNVAFGPDVRCWRVQNIAVPTRCSPESIRLGLRPTGWVNVQLQVLPPPGITIRAIRYVFHPAFSLNTLSIDTAPFDLVVKLCSSSVTVVIDITCDNDEKFALVHTLEKEMCTRNFFEPLYNGAPDPSKPIDPLTYFSQLLSVYRRAPDYYSKEMQPPARFQRRRQPRGGRSGSGLMRFLGGLFGADQL